MSEHIEYWTYSEPEMISSLNRRVLVKREQADKIWVGSSGERFLEISHAAKETKWMRVDVNIWRVEYQGYPFSLNWANLEFEAAEAMLLKRLALSVLAKRSPIYLQNIGSMFRSLSRALKRSDIKLRDVGYHEARILIDDLPFGSAVTFRSLLSKMSKIGVISLEGRELEDAHRIPIERTVSRVSTIRDATIGALTTLEQELFRKRLDVPDRQEDATDHFARLALRVCYGLGKRPSQIFRIRPDGILRDFQGTGVSVLLIPRAKGQRNEEPVHWPIIPSIADDLMAFSSRPEIQEAQQKLGFLLVAPLMPNSAQSRSKSATSAFAMIKDYVTKLDIISPRTKNPLNVTFTRLRHTLATNMARKGFDLEAIQEVLEHYSKTAAFAYLDAVGDNYFETLDGSDEALTSVFRNLSEAFFTGKVINMRDAPDCSPVFIPDPNKPALIGGCSCETSCPKHPFFACYSGCPFFLHFADFDISESLAFLRNEQHRWDTSEGFSARSRMQDDFARVRAGIIAAGRKECYHV